MKFMKCKRNLPSAHPKTIGSSRRFFRSCGLISFSLLMVGSGCSAALSPDSEAAAETEEKTTVDPELPVEETPSETPSNADEEETADQEPTTDSEEAPADPEQPPAEEESSSFHHVMDFPTIPAETVPYAVEHFVLVNNQEGNVLLLDETGAQINSSEWKQATWMNEYTNSILTTSASNDNQELWTLTGNTYDHQTAGGVGCAPWSSSYFDPETSQVLRKSESGTSFEPVSPSKLNPPFSTNNLEPLLPISVPDSGEIGRAHV